MLRLTKIFLALLFTTLTFAQSELMILMGDGLPPVGSYAYLTGYDTTLVMYLKFDEGTGDTALDSSPNVLADNGGKLKSGATWNATGKSGACLSLDGTNDYVEVPNSASLKLTNNFSISLWIDATGANTEGIITKITDGDAGYTIGVDASDIINFPDWNAGAQSGAAIGTAWKHIVAIQDAGTNKLYINGVLQETTSNRAVNDNDVNLVIGRIYSTVDGFYVQALIDEVMIFKKVLSETEITNIYNATN